jgi:tripartite motif-containing protein 71
VKTCKPELVGYEKTTFVIVVLLVAGFEVTAFSPIAQAKEEVQYISQLNANFKKPVDVAVSDSGDIYVLDKQLAQVVVFDKEGKIKITFGAKGSGPGKMYNPESIALSMNDEVLIADTGNDRILVFKTNGQFDYAIGSSGTNPGEFIMPNCVAVNTSGYIFISDKKNRALAKFTPKGVFLNQYALDQGPDDILFDRQNNLYILFSKQGKIAKYDAALKASGEITLIKEAKDFLKETSRIAVDHRGDIYLVRIGDNRIVKMTKDTNITLTFGSGGTGRGQFNFPLGIVTDSNDTLYIADSKNNRVQIFQLTGVQESALPVSKCEPPMIEYDSAILTGQKIVDIDYIADDGLYAVTEFDDDLIYRGKNSDILVKYSKRENNLRNPKGLCVLKDGNIIVADTGNNKLRFISPSGMNEYQFGVKGTDISQFNALEAVAVNQQGYIYVADTKNHRIQIFNSDGIYMSSFGKKSDDSNTRPAPGTFLKPKELVFSTTDELYVLDYGNKRIQIFDQQNQYVREIGGTLGDVQFVTPIDIAMDERDYLYVADRGRHAVVILDQEGKELLAFGSRGKGPSYFPHLTSIDSSLGKIYVSDYLIKEVRVFNFLAANPQSNALTESTVVADDR